MSLFPEFDPDKLDELTDGIPASTLTISEMTFQLCLSCLRYAEIRSFWRKSGNQLTDSEWDEAEAIVADAIQELVGNV